MLLDYVAYAAACPGVDRARVGRGTNNVTQRFLQRLAQHGQELGRRFDADGWVHFRPPSA
jgi:hypothetical protein